MNVIQFPLARARPPQPKDVPQVINPGQQDVDRLVAALEKQFASGKGPLVTLLPKGWPDGQEGAELERLAEIIFDRCASSGHARTLDHARRHVLSAYRDMEASMKASMQREREREGMYARTAELLVDRAARKGVDLSRIAASEPEGHDQTLNRIIAATRREARARIARSKQ